MQEDLHIGIMGAGAVGCYLGGWLATAGARLSLVGRPALGEEIAASGISVRDHQGRHAQTPASERLRYSTDPAILADCDLVLVTVKSCDTPEVGRILADTLTADALVISFQNGVRNPELLRASLPPQQVLAGMISFNIVRRPGASFQQGTTGPVICGTAGGAEARLVSCLNAAGVSAYADPEILGVQWGKLMFNLNNALAALSGLPLVEELGDRRWRSLLASAMGEALAACDAAGIEVRRLGRMRPRVARRVLPLPNWVFTRVAGAMLQINPTARSSMWDDLERGRTTEVSVLNGEVVALGRRVGVPTPINSAIVEAIQAAEQAGTGSPQLKPEQLG